MMTPEQARHLINADSRSTHGPLTDCRFCELVKRRAWEMAHQIADMHYEYAVQYQDFTGEWDYPESSPWKPTEEEARDEERTLRLIGFVTRIVRRLVTQPEEVQP